MAKDMKALLAKKLAENTQRHAQANQEAEFDVGREYTKINLELIDPNPYQPRQAFPTEELESLASSIQETGLLQPVSVRSVNGRYQLIAGERRLRAHKILGKQSIEAIIISSDDGEMAVWALAENIDRADLADYEIGKALRQIESLFPSKKSLAESVGLNREDMYRYFAFESLPEHILERLNLYPRLLSRSAAADVKRVLQNLESGVASELLDKAWKHLEQGELEQTKLAGWIAKEAKTRLASNLEYAPELKRDLIKGGSKVGSFVRDSRSLIIKLKLDTLTEFQAKQLEEYVLTLVSDEV